VKQAKDANQQQFKERIRQGVSLVDFNAPWCAPCRAQKPVIDHLAEKYAGRVAVMELDVDENRDEAMGLGIASIPTLILYKDSREVERFVGLQNADTLSLSIEKALQSSQ